MVTTHDHSLDVVVGWAMPHADPVVEHLVDGPRFRRALEEDLARSLAGSGATGAARRHQPNGERFTSSTRSTGAWLPTEVLKLTHD